MKIFSLVLFFIIWNVCDSSSLLSRYHLVSSKLMDRKISMLHSKINSVDVNNINHQSANYDNLIRLNEIRGGSMNDAMKGNLNVPQAGDMNSLNNVKDLQSTDQHSNIYLLVTYISFWYIFNIAFNISNKLALNMFPFPWTQSVLTLFIGSIYSLLIWLFGIRPFPKLQPNEYKALFLQAFFHAVGHFGAIISLGAGAVSFTHIVKAAEPVFTCIFSAIFLKSSFPLKVYLSLIPIVSGVAIASLKEFSFSWTSFIAAMVSNVAFAGRAILSKSTLQSSSIDKISPGNLYSVLNILSFIIALPFAVIMEGRAVYEVFSSNLKIISNIPFMISTIAQSGLYLYLYNELSYYALDTVHPITHAVANTIKRVVIIITSVIFFKTDMSPVGIAGSSIAILGTLLYSLAKSS